MKFVKTENGSVVEWPYTLNALRRDFPNVSFPSEITPGLIEKAAEHDIFPVTDLEDPAYDPYVEKLVSRRAGGSRR